jgi:predicted SprT family Zn-dependent metalloprotease
MSMQKNTIITFLAVAILVGVGIYLEEKNKIVIPADVQTKLQKGTDDLVDYYNETCGEKLPRFRLTYEDMSREEIDAVAKQNYGYKIIRLNIFLTKQQGVGMLDDSIPHELAHSIVNYKVGNVDDIHGPEWANAYDIMKKKSKDCNIKRRV